MKKISIMILVLVVALASCKKTPEVNLKYVDVERDLITVGTTTATVQCDYQYIATLKKAYLYYGECEDEADMNAAEMRVVQNTLYVDLAGLKESTIYSYYYEFHNGFNSMRTSTRTFTTENGSGGGGGGNGNAPEGAIDGLFSVSPTQKVYFSQGNLQYQASTNTWRFAEHQWDYVGDGELGTVYEGNVKCDNSLVSSTYNGWIDLFGWGTSGYNHGAVCYQPWSISEENSDYYAYGVYYYSLFEMSGQADWGYNSIINGGNLDGLWQTLTKDEIVYIINTRNTSSGIRFVKAIVNDVWGVVLLPDNWDASVYSFNSPNNSGASYNSNVIDSTTWINVFESNGAVFMPITLNRIGQSISNGNHGVNEGYYWLATYTQGGSAYNMYFSVIGLIPDDDCGDMDRHVGRAVRLVQNANPQNKAKCKNYQSY